MKATDVVGILQVGFSGFAFLIAGYSFHLLRAEARRDGTPRRSLLDAIKRYSNYTLIIAVLVAVSKAGDTALSAWNDRLKDEAIRTSQEAQTCRDALTKLNLGDVIAGSDNDSLRDAVIAAAPSCKTILRKLESN
jgi:hypothetical protein